MIGYDQERLVIQINPFLPKFAFDYGVYGTCYQSHGKQSKTLLQNMLQNIKKLRRNKKLPRKSNQTINKSLSYQKKGESPNE